MCPDCQVLRTSRSKHCAICNRCVERFDHHCPWLNNCVGIQNHNPYLVFIFSLLTVLILIILSSLDMLLQECDPKLTPDACPLIVLCVGCKIIWLRYTMLAITTLIAIFFSGPAVALCIVHMRNYSEAKTTNERYAAGNRNRADSEFSESVGSTADLRQTLNDQQLPKREYRRSKPSCYSNWVKMCCRNSIRS
jgi:palmitoyltransferase